MRIMAQRLPVATMSLIMVQNVVNGVWRNSRLVLTYRFLVTNLQSNSTNSTAVVGDGTNTFHTNNLRKGGADDDE